MVHFLHWIFNSYLIDIHVCFLVIKTQKNVQAYFKAISWINIISELGKTISVSIEVNGNIPYYHPPIRIPYLEKLNVQFFIPLCIMYWHSIALVKNKPVLHYFGFKFSNILHFIIDSIRKMPLKT